MPFFMVVTSLRFHERPETADGGRIDGAYQNIGVLADDEAEVRRIIASVVRDGSVDWDDSEVRRMDPVELQDKDFSPFVQDARPNAVWYMSGRCHYSDEGVPAEEAKET